MTGKWITALVAFAFHLIVWGAAFHGFRLDSRAFTLPVLLIAAVYSAFAVRAYGLGAFRIPRPVIFT